MEREQRALCNMGSELLGQGFMAAFVILSLYHKSRHHLEERMSVEALPPSYWPVGVSIGLFLDDRLMWEGGGRAQPTVGGPISGQVSLRCIQKASEQAQERKVSL